MSIVSLIITILVIVGLFSHDICADHLIPAHAVQIIRPTNNHSFELQLEEINRIFQADDIKDRDIVVISIVGAKRTGKSFLLNILLDYLYAKV